MRKKNIILIVLFFLLTLPTWSVEVLDYSRIPDPPQILLTPGSNFEGKPISLSSGLAIFFRCGLYTGPCLPPFRTGFVNRPVSGGPMDIALQHHYFQAFQIQQFHSYGERSVLFVLLSTGLLSIQYAD